MRKVLTALLLSVVAATPALAQPREPGDGRRGGYEARSDRPDPRGDRGAFRGGREDGRSDRGGWDGRDDRRGWQDRRDGVDGRFEGRRDQRADDRWNDRRGNDNRWNSRGWNSRGWNSRGWNDGRWDDGRGPGWDRGDRGFDRGRWSNDWRRDGRYDWQRYRAANRGFYTLPRYYGPQGFGAYRRWGVGYRIGAPFYGRNYWISDPYAYRLPPAYGSQRWVRYYDDVLLVDVASGLIRDALYGFFY